MKWERDRGRERPSPYGKSMRVAHDDQYYRQSGTCMCCGKYGHIKANCPDGHKTCDNCGLSGHLHSQCRQPPSCNACGSFDHIKLNCPYKDDTCGQCGKTGHLRVKCHQNPNNGATIAAPPLKECYGCGSYDHMKADCPARNKTCDLCGKLGHVKAKCNMRAASTATDVRDIRDTRDYRDHRDRMGSDVREDRECYGCGSRSHMKADCPAKHKTCDICGKEGHLKAMCRQRDDRDGRPERHNDAPVECYGCGSWDHRKIDCPARNKTCDNCGQMGHLARKCHRR